MRRPSSVQLYIWYILYVNVHAICFSSPVLQLSCNITAITPSHSVCFELCCVARHRACAKRNLGFGLCTTTAALRIKNGICGVPGSRPSAMQADVEPDGAGCDARPINRAPPASSDTDQIRGCSVAVAKTARRRHEHRLDESHSPRLRGRPCCAA